MAKLTPISKTVIGLVAVIGVSALGTVAVIALVPAEDRLPPTPAAVLDRAAPSKTSLDPVRVAPMYELSVGDRSWPIPGSVDVDGHLIKVSAKEHWTFSADGWSLEHPSSMVMTASRLNGRDEWTAFSREGHRARLVAAESAADVDAVVGQWREELGALGATPGGSEGIVVGGVQVPGEKWLIPGWSVSLHKVTRPRPLVVGLYVAEHQGEPVELLAALSTLAEERPVEAQFDLAVDEHSLPATLDQAVELPLKPAVTAVVRRRALIPRGFSGLTFEHDPSLVATEQHNPLLPSLLLAANDHSVQWVVTTDLTPSELQVALQAGISSESVETVRRDFGGRVLDGVLGHLEKPPATAEVFCFTFGGRTIGLVLQYSASSEAATMEAVQQMLATLR